MAKALHRTGPDRTRSSRHVVGLLSALTGPVTTYDNDFLLYSVSCYIVAMVLVGYTNIMSCCAAEVRDMTPRCIWRAYGLRGTLILSTVMRFPEHLGRNARRGHSCSKIGCHFAIASLGSIC
jgi:hypothetical protein